MHRSVLLFVVGATLFVSWCPCAQAQEKKNKTPIWSDQKDAFSDPLPAGAIARIGTTRYRLTSSYPPRSAVLSPDGTLLAVLRIPDEIEIWELPTWKRRHVIKGAAREKDNPHDFPPLVFSADSHKLATIDVVAKQICLFDVTTGKCTKKIAHPTFEHLRDASLKLSHDQQTLVCTQSWVESMDIRIYDLSKDQERQSFKVPLPSPFGHSSYHLRFVVSHDCRFMALQSRGEILKDSRFDNFLEFWDLAKGKMIRKVDADEGAELAFSPDGKWLAVVVGYQSLRIFNTATGKVRHHFRLREGPIHHVDFSPDSSSVFLAAEYDKILQWNTVSGERIGTYKVPRGDGVRQFAFGPGGKALAWGFRGYSVQLWDVAKGELLTPATQPVGAVTGLAFNSKSELFLAAEFDTFAWWNPRTGAKLRTLNLEFRNQDEGFHGFMLGGDSSIPFGRDRFYAAGVVPLVTLSNDGEFLVDGIGQWVSFYDARTGKVLYNDVLDGVAGPGAVSLFDGGNKAASIKKTSVQTWKTRDGRDLGHFTVPLRDNEKASWLAVSRAGKYFAFATFSMPWKSWEGRVLLWDAGQQKIVREWPKQNQVTTMKFSPDEQWLACAPGRDRLRLARLGSIGGDIELDLGKDVDDITQLAFSPDGRQLACAAILAVPHRDVGRLFIYEWASKKIRLELLGHPTGIIERLAYSPNGGLLASGATDTTALVWKAGLGAWSDKPAAKDATDEEISGWFEQLARANAKIAFQVMIKLVQTPKQTVKLFEGKIASVKKAGKGNNTLLHGRAVEVLEAIASPEARALLTRWTTGDAAAVLTVEAGRALGRLR